MVNNRAREQLAALAEIHELFEREAVDYWLFGGWAVDFHAGSVTRPHDDVDVAVWLADHERIAALLAAAGWKHAPEEDEDGGTGYERDAVRLELTFLVRGEDGRVYIPLRSGLVLWMKGAFATDVAELHGVRACVVGLGALREGKSRARDDAEDAEKDRADFATLSRQVPTEDNKDLIRRYIEAVDDNDSSDWSLIDDYIAEDFVAHNPPIPGVSLDREGMKQAAEIFRIATPGTHEIPMQVAEGDLVVSYIVGRGVHAGELLGIPATNKPVETTGIVIHRVREGKIVEYWSVVDIAQVLQQIGALPGSTG
jgi:predicted ester cyclase